MTNEDKLYADKLRNKALSDYERLNLAINELEETEQARGMTREQAINYLKSSGMTEEQIETVINALTCEDCISREAAIYIIYDYEYKKDMRKALEELPTVTPKILEPCEDCISRTELLTKIDEERKHLLDLKMDGAEHIIVHHARRIIEDMPAVIPRASKDCISRQAVIDIIDFEDKWLHDANGHNANTKIAFSGLRSRVKALPSVTPEESENK